MLKTLKNRESFDNIEDKEDNFQIVVRQNWEDDEDGKSLEKIEKKNTHSYQIPMEGLKSCYQILITTHPPSPKINTRPQPASPPQTPYLKNSITKARSHSDSHTHRHKQPRTRNQSNPPQHLIKSKTAGFSPKTPLTFQKQSQMHATHQRHGLPRLRNTVSVPCNNMCERCQPVRESFLSYGRCAR